MSSLTIILAEGIRDGNFGKITRMSSSVSNTTPAPHRTSMLSVLSEHSPRPSEASTAFVLDDDDDAAADDDNDDDEEEDIQPHIDVTPTFVH